MSGKLGSMDPITLLVSSLAVKVVANANPAIAELLRQLRERRKSTAVSPEMDELVKDLSDKLVQADPMLASVFRETTLDERFLVLQGVDPVDLPLHVAVMQMRSAETVGSAIAQWTKWLVLVTFALVLATLAVILVPALSGSGTDKVVNNYYGPSASASTSRPR